MPRFLEPARLTGDPLERPGIYDGACLQSAEVVTFR